MVLNTVSAEELRVRALQTAAAHAELPPLPTILHPTQHLSSIAPVLPKERPSPQFRPELSPPSTNPMHSLIRSQISTEKLAHKGTKIFELNVNQNIGDIERLNIEKEEALQKAAKESQGKDTWNVFATVSQYLVSASVIILGSACGVGTVPGALLIASGGIGLTNRVMHDTGGWEAVVSWFTESEELQQRLARNIETGMFFLSLGLGIAGGVTAVANGAFNSALEAGRQTLKAKIGQTVGLAGAVMGAGSRLGGAFKEKNLAYLQARIREIEAQTTASHQTIYQNSTGMEKLIETPQAIGEEVRKAVSTSQISFE